jgi:predicted component of type VI protein secretion system
MPPRLIALDNEHTLLLDKPIILIGRHEECDIQLESRKVSRRHCCVAQVETHLVVRDLESTNGIRINGHQVLEGTLSDGDELTIGNLRYQVRWEDDDPLAAKAARPEVRANKIRPRPAAIPHDNLMSCDMPMPLKEPSHAPKEHVALANGTERAPDAQVPPGRREKRTEKQEAVSPLPDARSRKEQLPNDDGE